MAGLARNYLIRNQTPQPIRLHRGSYSFALAPLQTRRIGAELMDSLREAAEQANQKQEVEWEQEPLRSRRLMWASSLAAAGFAGALIGLAVWLSAGKSESRIVLTVTGAIVAVCVVAEAGVLGRGRQSATPRRWTWPMWVLTVAAVVAVAFAVASALRKWPLALIVVGFTIAATCAIWPAYRLNRQPLEAAHQPGVPRRVVSKTAPTAIRGDIWSLVRDWLIAAAYGIVAVLVLLVGVAVPAVAIYYGTDMSKVVVLHGWHEPTLIEGAHQQDLVVGRLLQIVLLILVSLVPALMFFQFDREKLTTLIDRWLHAIFRLDPSLRTIADVDAKYGRRVEEFYGATLGLGVVAARKRMRDRSPVVVATLLIALGWIVLLLEQDARTSNLATIHALFQVSPDLFTLAFMGAYFLAVQVTLRGYIRGDLKPKTYNVIIVRILMAVILALVMDAIWGVNTYTQGLAFLSGILPNTVLRIMREMIEHAQAQAKSVSRRLAGRHDTSDGRKAHDELREKSPLWELDDVDIYDRTRLEEEGITSVQSLARHDLIDLILSTRIPVQRLVDWMDQAMLHLHADDRSLQSLKRLGIRTATDYIIVYRDRKARRALVNALAVNRRDAVLAASIDVLHVVLQGEEWIEFLLNWRTNDGTKCMQEKVYPSRAAPKATIAATSNGHGEGSILGPPVVDPVG